MPTLLIRTAKTRPFSLNCYGFRPCLKPTYGQDQTNSRSNKLFFWKTASKKTPDELDITTIKKIEESAIDQWCPANEMLFKGKEWGDTWRSGVHEGITHTHHFYSTRNLRILSEIVRHGRKTSYASQFLFLLTSVIDRLSRRNRYMPQHRGNRSREVVGPLSGTLYVPTFSLEINPIDYCISKIKSVVHGLSAAKWHCNMISTSSTTSCHFGENSVDYIFTDPPFGGNLLYSELNFLTKVG